jgi:hypothetical protein
MGAFKDLLDVLRATVGGLVPLGGTLNPVSEGVPIAFAQNIKGNFAVYPTKDAVADIPYELLVVDMEVIVKQYVLPDLTNHPRTKYRLKQLTSDGSKINANPLYNFSDWWEALAEPGEGEKGDKGDAGWSALYLLEDDGPTRVVERFHGWIGGAGTPPPAPTPPNDYRGSAGYVSKSSAINVKGPAGAPGSETNVRPPYYNSVGTRRTTGLWTSTSGNWNKTNWGTFEWASIPLPVSNTWTQNRKFMIFGEVPVSQDNGVEGLAVQMLQMSNTSNTVASCTVRDENFAYIDKVGGQMLFGTPKSSVYKINTRYVIELAPGQTVYFKLAMTQLYGGYCWYDEGFIEAIGL